MRCSAKFLTFVICIGAALSGQAAKSEKGKDSPKDPAANAAAAKAKEKDKAKGKDNDKANDKDKDKANDKGKDKAKGKDNDKKKDGGDEGENNKMSIPLTKDHPSMGLKIPYFNGEGKLQMSFNIGMANRIDDNHVKMNDTQVETFNSEGESEMHIDLPLSVLDLTTRVITTNQAVKIKRADFELTGQTMEFNTETKRGKLGGGVRMLIYNLDNERAEQAEKTPRE